MTYTVTQLPLYEDPHYRYSINLEGQQRALTFYWNSRTETWHLDWKNGDGTTVILGLPLVPQHPLLGDYQLGEYGITGYLLLLPNSDRREDVIHDITTVPQFYELFYIHDAEE